MPFSNLFTLRKKKRSSVMYPPGFHNNSAVDLDWCSPHINEMTMSTYEPLKQLEFGFDSTTSTHSSENVQQHLQGYQSPYSSNSNENSSLAPYDAAPQPSKPARYYSHVLSPGDKAALSRGDFNHNLNIYGHEDMIKHHESRKSLVPQGFGASKLRKMEAFAKIEEEKQHSQRVFDKKASQSMYDLRSSSALVPRLPYLSTVPALPPVPTLRRKYSWEAIQAPSTPYQNVRTAGGTDFFSYVPSEEASSKSTSRTSSRAPSPLSDTDTAHQHNPDTTFDTFLVPHKSGKGEAYRGTVNANETKPGADIGVCATGPEKEKASRRFTKTRSTLTLR